ncbi:hypothetical protein [Pyrolobus fumarii]|uniref:hypothetical protein n=1 Tax=Pyrolobus fumarii TaxID=54252 RepID=UPI0014331358|nr:hypothetical protein [Pyrolobus fumarii]
MYGSVYPRLHLYYTCTCFGVESTRVAGILAECMRSRGLLEYTMLYAWSERPARDARIIVPMIVARQKIAKKVARITWECPAQA